jgi:hypothetical protein
MDWMIKWGIKTLTLILVLCVGTEAGRAGPIGTPEVDEAHLLGLARGWADGVGENRPDALNLVLDDQYEHMHGTGLMETKGQFLEALRSGVRKYDPIKLEELRVRTFDGFALVTGKFALKVEVRGKTMEGTNRFCMTLIERTTGWKILQFQATALPSKP